MIRETHNWIMTKAVERRGTRESINNYFVQNVGQVKKTKIIARFEFNEGKCSSRIQMQIKMVAYKYKRSSLKSPINRHDASILSVLRSSL